MYWEKLLNKDMMKKVVAFLCVVLCAGMMHAASFGILVNGKMYYAGTNNPTPADPSFQEYMVLGVSLNQGDYCQLYDADNKVSWVVVLDTYSTKDIAMGDGKYTINKTACYDFYIKLKYEEDQLYVGGDAVCTGITGVDITKEDPQPGYDGAAPAQCPDVMLQGFYWDSYKDKGYGRTKWIDHLNAKNGTSATEIGQWFDLVWLPPMSKATGGTGYHPVNYGDLNSDWGTETKLKELINVFHTNGARVVADIVINHADAQQDWCNFGTYNFGEYGSFSPDPSWICKTDEMNTSSKAGSCKGKATGADDDGYGSEANYDASRDWDHTNPQVQAMFKAYLQWLRHDVNIDGFRYDYCKGFNNGHINDYNQVAKPYFSVMEFWDGNIETLQYHLGAAGWNTLVFDFNMKYNAFNEGIASDNYGKLKNAGLPGVGKARYSCTFVDSHDTFQRASASEFCGDGNSMTICQDKVVQCYAYMLSMPGVPCVFYPHWVTFKDQIKPLINARYKAGVHSESAVSDEAGDGYYKATITGKNGEIRLLLGPNSGYNSTPSGYTLAGKGVNYGVYYKMTSARGDKDTERVPVTEGIEETTVDNQRPKAEKFVQNGQLFIRVAEKTYDAQGRLVK